MSRPILEVSGLCMRFGGLLAVNDINKESGLTLGIASLLGTVNRELIPTLKTEVGGAFQVVRDLLAFGPKREVPFPPRQNACAIPTPNALREGWCA